MAKLVKSERVEINWRPFTIRFAQNFHTRSMLSREWEIRRNEWQKGSKKDEHHHLYEQHNKNAWPCHFHPLLFLRLLIIQQQHQHRTVKCICTQRVCVKNRLVTWIQPKNYRIHNSVWHLCWCDFFYASRKNSIANFYTISLVYLQKDTRTQNGRSSWVRTSVHFIFFLFKLCHATAMDLSKMRRVAQAKHFIAQRTINAAVCKEPNSQSQNSRQTCYNHHEQQKQHQQQE